MNKVVGALSIALGLLVSLSLPSEARYRCKDFTSAQQVIDAYRAGATYLDRDHDGYACEHTLNVYVGPPAQNRSITDPSQAVMPPYPSRRKGQSSPSSVSIPTATPREAVHLTMGNPSQASTQPDNFLLLRPQYALSYNASKGIPNWVSWQLNQSWLGPVDRQNDFRPDETLPPNFYHVTPSDYSGTGYDRGHQAPSADRTRNAEDNSATFLMSNMIPQAPDLNRGPWEKLESYARQLVSEGKELYITAGVEGQKDTLAGGKISVPTRNWKVIVVLDKPGLGLNGVTATTRVIAVDMPNENGIKETDWTE
ncbi:MAG: DNA/RNA non-specific endonuclease, partial [Kovacikia sp.]